MNALYPVFLKLAGSHVLIVGGGALALQKLRTLAETGARVTLVAPAFREPLPALAAETGAELVRREFLPADLEGAALVFAATDDPELNRRVFQLAGGRGVLANAVDDPEFCAFYTPSVVRRAGFSLAISSEGRFPGVTKALREVLEAWFPGPDADLLRGLFEFRRALRRRPAAQRGRALRRLLAAFRREYLEPPAPAEPETPETPQRSLTA